VILLTVRPAIYSNQKRTCTARRIPVSFVSHSNRTGLMWSHNSFIASMLVVFSFPAAAQVVDTASALPKSQVSYKVSLLIYSRVISDTHGGIRVDENLVPNFKLNKWFQLELGLRHGQRIDYFNSYYHYKVELQSKTPIKGVRLLARLSDNIVNRPNPNYRKTNELIIVETRHKVSSSFEGLLAGGYAVSHQQNNSSDALPINNQGTRSKYGIWKVALRYLITEKKFIEGSWGSYDVFNPYLPRSPFLQLSGEAEFNSRSSLYCGYRYQYDHSLGAPLNNFFTAGVRLRLAKG
jgi:hypothetical protein